jgi:hypothetical protein
MSQWVKAVQSNPSQSILVVKALISMIGLIFEGEVYAWSNGHKSKLFTQLCAKPAKIYCIRINFDTSFGIRKESSQQLFPGAQAPPPNPST